MNRRPAILCSLVLCASLAGTASGGEASGRKIFEKHVATTPADEQVEVRLDIYRRVGVSEVDLSRPRMTVRLRRGIRGKGAAARIRIDVLKPPAMAGIALTAEWDAKRRKHRVVCFLPATSSLRSVGYLRTPFVQSHLLYEHIVPLVPNNFKFTAKGRRKVKGVDCHVVEAEPVTSSAYTKIVYYIRKDNFKAAGADYYTRGFRGPELTLVRTVKSDDVEEWVMKKTGEKTVLTFSGRKNEAPSEERFKPGSLKSNPSMVQLMKERAKLLDEEDRLKRQIKKLRAEIAKLKAKQ